MVTNPRHRFSRRVAFFTLLLTASGLAVILALALGSVTAGGDSIWSAWHQPEHPLHDILWRVRAPRVGAAWLTGALLALAGVLMQVLLRNPLADPYILGASGGAACFALLAMSFAPALPVPFAAFAGALATTILVFVLARGHGPWNGTRLLLTGVMVAAAWGALISLLLSLGPEARLRGMLFWLMGDLSWAATAPWMWLVFAVLLGVLTWMARALNVMVLGETHAALLGEEPVRLAWSIYVAASLATALAVTIGGAIGFVGLLAPHLMRLAGGADHRLLLPASALFGGLFLTLADLAARTVVAPRQLPVGVVTALLGAPLFIVLLYRNASRG